MLLDDHVLRSVLDTDPEGILVCDVSAQNQSIVYTNPAMERLTGYSPADLLGRSFSFLERLQFERTANEAVRQAFASQTECQLQFTFTKRDGTACQCKFKSTPVLDAQGGMRYLVSYWHEIQVSTAASAEAPGVDASYAAAMTDPLTGVMRRVYFEERLKRDWDAAAQGGRVMTVYLFEIDCLSEYEASQGRLEGEQVVRRVARTTGGCFRRAQDLCSRFDYNQIAVLAARSDLAPSLEYAEVIQGRIRELKIHHPQSSAARIVTVSIGIASKVPQAGEAHSHLLDGARVCLHQARERGRNRAIGKAL